MNFDTSIIKIGWKMGKLWAFKNFQYGEHLAAILNIQLVSRIFSTAKFLVITSITSSVFQQICSFIHKENVSLKINANSPLVYLLF